MIDPYDRPEDGATRTLEFGRAGDQVFHKHFSPRSLKTSKEGLLTHERSFATLRVKHITVLLCIGAVALPYLHSKLISSQSPPPISPLPTAQGSQGTTLSSTQRQTVLHSNLLVAHRPRPNEPRTRTEASVVRPFRPKTTEEVRRRLRPSVGRRLRCTTKLDNGFFYFKSSMSGAGSSRSCGMDNGWLSRSSDPESWGR